MIERNMGQTNFYCIAKNHYENDEISDFDTWLLYNLLDDFSSEGFYEFLIKKLNNFNGGRLAGQASSISIENDRVTIQDTHDSQERTLVINRAHLLELVKKWRELCEQSVLGIVISREGDKFEIEAIK